MHGTILFLMVFAALLAGCAAGGTGAEPAPSPAAVGGQWWKGNLHTHSLWSDGDDYAESILDWYRERGYHFVAMSDHNILPAEERWVDLVRNRGAREGFARYRERFGDAWVEQRQRGDTTLVRLRTVEEYRARLEQPGRFLVLPAEEITQYVGGKAVHVNATNLAEPVREYLGNKREILRANLEAVRAQRERTRRPMIAHVNHPNFLYSLTAEDLIATPDARFFELYNAHPLVNNPGDSLHVGTERMWDIVLSERLSRGGEPLYGVATDDAHDYHRWGADQRNPGRAWVRVRAPSLTPEALIGALEAGDFYASTGVELEDLRRDRNGISLRIRAEPGVSYTTRFIGTREGYDPRSQPRHDTAGVAVTRSYSDEIGVVLAEVPGASPSYRFRGDELYVRARVVSSKPMENAPTPGEVETAWTQPWVVASPSAPAAELTVIPAPREVALTGRSLSLPDTLACDVADESLWPLLPVIDYEYRMLTGGRVVAAGPTPPAPCRLSLDPSLAGEEYRLEIGDAVHLAGGSYRAVAMGTVTLMQALRSGPGGASVPMGTIRDRPDTGYRGLLIDLARKWHDLPVIEQVILLARWYKINHLQLHLTDDQLFTFPTESYPLLPTPGHHYTREQLRRLDAFARDRGVTLVPELDVPGHSSQMVTRMPELFGIRDWERNRGTLNMGREAVYQALDRILGEVAELFSTSPYIHIGGDEAGFQHHADDPDVQRYLAAHGLADVDELYRHFLVRMNEIVKRHGKQTIVWEGFHRDGRVEIPRDVVVMAWETLYQLPQDLLAGAYTLINVAWQPLYVVNDRKWEPEYIYGWNLYRWENWLPHAPAFTPIQLEPTPQVIGASMASWDQAQHLEIPTLRKRLPAMSERIWSATLVPDRPLSWFLGALERTDSALQRILGPVEVRAEGLLHPEVEDGRYHEQDWFVDRLVVRLSAPPGLTVRYTTDGSEPTAASPAYTGPLTLSASTSFQARAFRADGEPAGYARGFEYRLRPVHVSYEGRFAHPPEERWRKIRSWEIDFIGALTVRLSSGRPGVIRYTTDGADPTPSSAAYSGPIVLRDHALVKAQLFDAAGEPVGEPWAQHFRRSDTRQPDPE